MFNPEAFVPVLQKVQGILDQVGIPFHLTGGLVSVYYAEPRLTQDADLVIHPERLRTRLNEFLGALRSHEYVANEATIRDAVARGRMFQVIDSQECLKVDFYPRELIPGAIDRAISVELFPQLTLPLASLPDLIASKVFWISRGGHKSRRDVRQLFLRADDAERETTRQFVQHLSLLPLLDEVLAEPDELD